MSSSTDYRAERALSRKVIETRPASGISGATLCRAERALSRKVIETFYAVCQFKDGTKKYEVMSKKEVDDIRKRSRAGQSGPWVTDYEEMAKKTVFKRLSKWLPVTPDLEAAVEHDNQEYQSNSNQFDRSSRVTANELLGGDDGHEVVDAEVVDEA